jgi:hypothetical protein
MEIRNLKSLHKTLLYPVQNTKEFHTKRLCALMQTSLRFISNVLAIKIKRKGVFSVAFSLPFKVTFHSLCVNKENQSQVIKKYLYGQNSGVKSEVKMQLKKRLCVLF